MADRENIYGNTEQRMLYLSDDICDTTISKVCFNLLYMLKCDDERESKEKDFKREPIKLFIQSFGGEVYDMWALIDIIENSKTPIHTYCMGYAMSAAFKIFLAGHKRFASKHSTFLYHQMNCVRHGKYQDLVEDRVEMDWLNKQNEDYVISRTKLTQAFIDEAREKKKDVIFHIDDALKYGIVDEVI